MEAVLKEFFGFGSLRPYQKDVIDQVLSSRDCLVVMATGGGKSLCYQLPPLITHKTSIVVSPLLSLMQDQVMSLRQKGIQAEYLGSTQTNPSVVVAAQAGHYNVLYMTPEKAMSLAKSFWSTILRNGVCLLAVDEAHCISEWGSDFRMEYKKLSNLRRLLPGVPFVALTATATEGVRNDIRESLCLVDPFVYVGSFDRPNLFYGVKLLDGAGKIDTFLAEVLDVLSERVKRKESSIVYCTTIRDTEEVNEALNSNSIPSCMYHGKMDAKSRQISHRSFVNDEVAVMVATIAFGMGIDKPDVRCVIHYGCPKSLEGYYQESGRCGRDGLPSRCLLYYRRADFSRGDFFTSEISSVEQKESIMRAFLAGQKYCCLLTCRRQELLNYFGQPCPKRCSNCDNCIDNTSNHKDISKEAALLMQCIEECCGVGGLNTAISVLRGSNAQKIIENNLQSVHSHGKGKDHKPDWWKSLGYVLIGEGYIADDVSGTSRILSLSTKGSDFLTARTTRHEPLVVNLPAEMIEDEDTTCIVEHEAATEICSSSLEISLTSDEAMVYEMLLEARKSLATENGAAPYAICSDQVLRLLAKHRPSTLEELADVDGVNLNFINRFGVIIIHCIQDMAPRLNSGSVNFASHKSDEESDDLFILDDLPQADQTVADAILEIIRAHDGVSFEDIERSIDIEMDGEVESAIEYLKCSFEIYVKNGLFFTL